MIDLINQQLLVKHYKDEVKREPSLANVALLDRARLKLLEMKKDGAN